MSRIFAVKKNIFAVKKNILNSKIKYIIHERFGCYRLWDKMDAQIFVHLNVR